ncbi:uncharacterized protein LOC121774153 [Salvia splendens]|uniref:uncharacterized protein LOC121774153 n=1 Tax=Salvia splendens TaxID=180675 RepID=UPI001C27F48F|nr:uncharacterized protein LOC121774153 [Salvia splendens]
MKRFGDNIALDEYEAFAAVRHDSSLTVATFEARLFQIPDLSNHQYLGFFLAAPRPDIRMHMKAANITNYSDAVQLALRIDHVATGSLRPSVRRFLNVSSEEYRWHIVVKINRPLPSIITTIPQLTNSPNLEIG